MDAQMPRSDIPEAEPAPGKTNRRPEEQKVRNTEPDVTWRKTVQISANFFPPKTRLGQQLKDHHLSLTTVQSLELRLHHYYRQNTP